MLWVVISRKPRLYAEQPRHVPLNLRGAASEGRFIVSILWGHVFPQIRIDTPSAGTGDEKQQECGSFKPLRAVDALEARPLLRQPQPANAHRRRYRAAARVCLASTRESFDQVILPSFLALNVDHRAIGGHVGLPVQRHLDRKTGRRVVSNDLNTGNGLTSWP